MTGFLLFVLVVQYVPLFYHCHRVQANKQEITKVCFDQFGKVEVNSWITREIKRLNVLYLCWSC